MVLLVLIEYWDNPKLGLVSLMDLFSSTLYFSVYCSFSLLFQYSTLLSSKSLYHNDTNLASFYKQGDCDHKCN